MDSKTAHAILAKIREKIANDLHKEAGLSQLVDRVRPAADAIGGQLRSLLRSPRAVGREAGAEVALNDALNGIDRSATRYGLSDGYFRNGRQFTDSGYPIVGGRSPAAAKAPINSAIRKGFLTHLGKQIGVGGGVGLAGYETLKPSTPQAKTAGDPTGDAFAGALQSAHASALKQDAMGDVARIGGTALAVGAGARGLIGLIRMLRENSAAPKKTRSGPTMLPLPYPAAPKTASYLTDVLSGDLAGDKTGIPAYMPAAALAGVAGLGLGWKGIDSVLASQRKAEQDEEMEKARSEFHDALIGQYKRPISTHPGLMGKKAEDASPAADLDIAFDAFETAFGKQSFDLSNLAGQAAGGYGVYAGLSGLLAGSLVYDKIQKRSRGAVLQKALQRRQRRQFAQSPTEIYATPEPMEIPAPESEKDEVPALRG